MENINLIKGNCLEKLQDISNNSVDCFIMDLPYGITREKWDNKINLNDLWIQLKRIAKNNHTPYFFFCDMKLAVDIINSNNKWFRYELVIHKSRAVGFLNAKRMPMKTHEFLLVFYENLPLYNVEKYHIKTKNYSSKGGNTIYGDIKNRNNSKYEPPMPLSILKMNNNNKIKKYHKTQKEQDILEWIINYYTNENDTILDPTFGSGSTAVACKKLNRRFIGIELNEEYFNIAKERLI